MKSQTPSHEQQVIRDMKKVLLLRFTWSIILIQSVMTPFFIDKGLSLEEIFRVQAVFSFFLIFFELPTGALSDLIGRKAMLIIATLVRGAGGTCLFLLDGFWGMTIAYALLAAGNSSLSGSDVSFLVEKHKELTSKDKTLSFYLGRLRFLSLIAAMASALLGGLIAQYSMEAAGFSNMVFAWFAFPAACSISGQFFDKTSQKEKSSALQSIKVYWLQVKSHITSDTALTLTILTTSLFMFFATASTYAFQMRWIGYDFSVILIAAIFAIRSIVAGCSSLLLPKYIRQMDFTKILILGIFCSIIALFLAIPDLIILNLAAAMLLSMLDGIHTVLLVEFINNRTSSGVRATINSSVSFINRLAMTIFAPFLGFVISQGDISDVFVVLLIVAIAGAITIILPLLSRVKDVPMGQSNDP